MDYNADFLKSIECINQPDPRNKLFSEYGIEKHHKSISRYVLKGTIPEDIRIQFETVKNIYLYAWFVYRLYPVARLYAYTCLELAMRNRFEPEMLAAGEKAREFGPGLKRLLSYAIDNGHIKNEGFEIWRRQKARSAAERAFFQQIEEMERLGLSEIKIDDSEFDIVDKAYDYRYLAVLLETIPWLRNSFAHGNATLDNQALVTIQLVSEIINQIYE